MSEKLPALVVDKEGLARKLTRRPKTFIVFELIQNAWDEDVNEVSLEAKMVEDGICSITVRDDCPAGFQEMESVYTLFRDSKKASDPTKRGRFELGEKLVIASALDIKLVTTKGTVVIKGDERHHYDEKTKVGTTFTARFKMTKQDLEEILSATRALIPPTGIKTTVNGKALPERNPIRTFRTQLPTEIADEDGYLRPTRRMTEVEVQEVLPDEEASIYEMGIPVVTTGNKWHVNVMQKVPLNSDRDNVTPGYLQKVRTALLNEMFEDIHGEEVTSEWVRAASGDKNVLPEAVMQVMYERFGKKRVVVDPSDSGGTKIAMAQGYQIVYPGSLSKGEWDNVRKFNAILPAGKVTPSPKPYDPSGHPEKEIPESEWTDDMRSKAEFARLLFQEMEDLSLNVVIVMEPSASWRANFGDRRLCLNYGRLGKRWFALPNRDVEVLDLLLHEFIHHTVSDHLSNEMHKTATRLGARLVNLCLDKPDLFKN